MPPRRTRRCRIHRIARFERAGCGSEFLQEAVGQRINNNEPLPCDAALPGIVHLGPNRPFHSQIEVSVFEDDKRIATAKFHRRLLNILTGSCCDAPRRFNATDQRDPFNLGLVDHAVHLLI